MGESDGLGGAHASDEESGPLTATAGNRGQQQARHACIHCPTMFNVQMASSTHKGCPSAKL